MILPAEQSPEVLIPATEIVHSLMFNLGMDRDDDMHDAEHAVIQWLRECNMDMGAHFAYTRAIANAHINEDGQVPKPPNYVSLLKALIGDEGGQSCYTPIHITSIEPARARETPETYERPKEDRQFTIAEDPRYFHVSSNAFGKNLHIAYRAMLVDEQGMPYIDRRFRETYESWVSGKYNRRKGNRNAAAADFQEYGMHRQRQRGNVVLDAMTRDRVDQMAAQFNDPFYMGNNPYYHYARNKRQWEMRYDGPYISDRNFHGHYGHGFPILF
jgi:hypothetical protein